jgi:hypothetical protein
MARTSVVRIAETSLSALPPHVPKCGGAHSVPKKRMIQLSLLATLRRTPRATVPCEIGQRFRCVRSRHGEERFSSSAPSQASHRW